jgi:tRNA-2-methylthio-N6-dimethylallyladenosine synthase
LAERFDLIFEIKNLCDLEKFFGDEQGFVGTHYFNVLPKVRSKFSVYVPIMTGCNNYCSYCAVPYVRGREQSRPVRDVVAEIKKLVIGGAKEICLLGQNVNSYNPPDKKNFSALNPFKHDFARLLWEVDQIAGVERINFASVHPKDVSGEMIEALKLPKQLNYLHLAVQSGDDVILKRMNRKYTAADFEKLIQKIRAVKPDIAIGTDIIVGFPGETNEQFENTLHLYARVRFDIAYLAMYSPRVGTAAARLADDVPHKEKKRRWRALQDLMEKIVLEKNQKYLGRDVEVLVDKVRADFVEGNSREMKRVRIYGQPEIKIGDLVRVRIEKAMEWILEGEKDS